MDRKFWVFFIPNSLSKPGEFYLLNTFEHNTSTFETKKKTGARDDERISQNKRQRRAARLYLGLTRLKAC